MKRVLISLMFVLLFVVGSCDSGTKKNTDKDLGISDTDVINDVEVTDDESTDHDSSVFADDDATPDTPLTDDNSPVSDDSEYTDEEITDDYEDEDSDVFQDEGPDDIEKPAQGEEGGDCYPNDTCNKGLECVDGLCVIDDDAFIPEEYTVDGFVQKGPFVQDSSIKITELDHNFKMIPATTFTTQTIDDLGNFSIKRTFSSRYILLEASGYYYNEIAGAVSSGAITNFVFVDLKANNSKIGINILTTLARRRIQYLMKQGGGFNEAREQAEKEVLEIFGIFGEPAANFQDMDILKAGNSNAMLLAISARLQAGNTPGQLSMLTAGMIYEIEETGKLTNDALKTSISDGSVYIADKLTDIRNNLDTYFGSKTTVDIPNFEDYCDDDGNGIINKWDFDLNFGDAIENAERDTAYTSEEKTVKVNPATTAVAKTTLGTIVINGIDTGLSESPINDGDKLSVRVVSSNEFETTVTAVVTVEFDVTDGYTKVTASGSYSVTTGECDYDDIQIADNVCGDGTGASEQKCIEGIWVNQGACTRVFNCSPKPDNSVWNSVDKYTQTWSGSAWDPTDSTTEYSTELSNVLCRYKCNATSFRIDNQCVAGTLHKGLYWSPRSTGAMTWSSAITYCEGLGGRLSNIQELRMLIKECPQNEYPKPAGQDPWCAIEDPGNLGGDACSGCTSDGSGKYSVFGDIGRFWSSSSYVNFTLIAWGVDFNFGRVASYYKADYFNAALCVR